MAKAKAKSKAKKSAKKHSVVADLTVHQLSKATTSLRLQISDGTTKLGEVEIGQGSIIWWGHRRRTRKRISWTKFAQIMDEHAYGG